MSSNEISSAIAARLTCAEAGGAVHSINHDPWRPTPAQIEAMERGGYHTFADEARDWAEGKFAENTPRFFSKQEELEHAEAVERAHAALEAAEGGVGLPTDRQARKDVPLYSGLLRYFPDPLAAVAHLSKVGNDQHNPGEPLHWSRGKSDDHPDCLLRHLMDAGTVDTDGVRHSAKVAWRALAMLQLEIEAAAKGGKS